MLQRAYARSIVPLSQWQALLSPHTRGAEVAIPSEENLRGRFTCFSRPDRTASSCPVSISRRCAAQLPTSPRPMGCMFASTIRSSSDSPEPVPTPRPLHDWRRRTDRSARTVLSHQVVALRIFCGTSQDGSQGGAPLSHSTPPRAMRLQLAAMQRSVRLLQAPHWKTSRDTVHVLVRVCVTTCRHQLHSPCTSVSPCEPRPKKCQSRSQNGYQTAGARRTHRYECSFGTLRDLLGKIQLHCATDSRPDKRDGLGQ